MAISIPRGPARSPAPGAVPRSVKKAMELIDADLSAPIDIADLIAASEVSGRTLFKHFRRFIGLSPMAYLRARRLERVHDALRRGEAESVTDAALRWGFTHLGRFAGAYVRMCGERPSATLRRARDGDEALYCLARLAEYSGDAPAADEAGRRSRA